MQRFSSAAPVHPKIDSSKMTPPMDIVEYADILNK